MWVIVFLLSGVSLDADGGNAMMDAMEFMEILHKKSHLVLSGHKAVRGPNPTSSRSAWCCAQWSGQQA